MQAAIVTGATGMIASALIRNLIQKGVKVYALCNPAKKKMMSFSAVPL